MNFTDVNFLAVLLAAIASIFIGGFWYSPALFGNIWVKLSGFTQKDMDAAKAKGMGKSYALTFAASLVKGYILAVLLKTIPPESLSGALLFGFLAWLGFMATASLNMVLWEGKPFKLYLIQNGHDLVSLLVMSLIIGLWPA